MVVSAAELLKKLLSCPWFYGRNLYEPAISVSLRITLARSFRKAAFHLHGS